MYDYSNLLKKIKKYGVKKFFSKCSISYSDFNCIVRSNMEFTLDQMEEIMQILSIKKENAYSFFFNKKVSCKEISNNPLKDRKITMNGKIDFKIYLPKNLLIKREEEFNKLIEIIADTKEKHPNIRMGVEVRFYGDEFEE